VANAISLQGLREIDYSQLLSRLMRRQNIVLMLRAVRLGSIGIVALSAVIFLVVAVENTFTRLSLQSELSSRVETLAANVGKPTDNTPPPDKDWKLITRRPVFGALGKAAGPATPNQPPPSPLSLTLNGTFVIDGEEPYAIIEDKKKQQQDMFLLGQSIFEQATLKQIYQDRVEIERLGKIEVLRLDEFGSSDGPTVGGVSNNGDDFVVDEAEVDKGLENLPLLLTQARAVPYFKDGRSIGLRMFAIKTGSLYEKIGLKNGDILKSINGNSLADITQALKLFEQLKQERSISLVLERDKQDREFKYTIR
jgi:general secretion pathway protein C